MRLSRHQKGISLIEVLIVVAIVSIVVSLSAPSFVSLQRNIALKGATQEIFFLLKLAKSSAIRKNDNIVVDASVTNGGATWCMGITDTGNCDCATANSCTIDGREQIVSSDDFRNIVMQNLDFDDADQVVFDGTRAMATNGAADVEISDNVDQTIRVNIAATGRVSLCNAEGDTGGYGEC